MRAGPAHQPEGGALFGKSTLGLAYSIFITDALIAPGFPSNTARGGVLFPIILSLAQGSGSLPEDEAKRRLGGYLMFCGMASLASPRRCGSPPPRPIRSASRWRPNRG